VTTNSKRKAQSSSAQPKSRVPKRALPATVRGSATRRRIVQAARGVIVKHGPLGLTLRAVAADSDMSLSNLQFYFSSHDDLLRAVLDDELAAGEAFVASAVQRSPDDAAGAAIDAMLALQHQRGAARLFFSLWAMATSSRPLRSALHTFYTDWIARIALVAPPEARQRAWLFVALMEGASLFRCGVAGQTNAAEEQALREQLRALVGLPTTKPKHQGRS
jgi:AcrR family transcriptional regulator